MVSSKSNDSTSKNNKIPIIPYLYSTPLPIHCPLTESSTASPKAGDGEAETA